VPWSTYIGITHLYFFLESLPHDLISAMKNYYKTIATEKIIENIDIGLYVP